MKNNYCWINTNKIYAEIYDELLDEELSMFNKDHNDKIKRYLEKKILSSEYIDVSETFESSDDCISDLILKINSTASSKNLQGNTVLMFADNNNMYELFHMEDLKKKFPDSELNELCSISNIHLIPVYWGCGIFKSNYSNGLIRSDIITKKDLINIFTQNYYHIGVMIGTNNGTNNEINNEINSGTNSGTNSGINNSMIEIEFTGEDPYKVIGTGFTQKNVTNVIGFNFIPYVENGNEINVKASEIFGIEMKGRVFISLLCPTSNKKFWNINIKTIENILKIIENNVLFSKIQNEVDNHDSDKDINPFYLLNKTLENH